MRYEGRVFRPPSEAYSLIVQATVGCSHNKCTFCDMYKEKQFHLRPLDQVLEDFDIARRTYQHIDRVFLADGDALIRKTSDLVAILEHIRKVIPECTRVTSYGSPVSILTKSPEDLALLQRDCAAANAHYDRYEGKVQDAAQKVNDTYLKAFSEESGVQSYGEAADYLIAWYLQKSA